MDKPTSLKSFLYLLVIFFYSCGDKSKYNDSVSISQMVPKDAFFVKGKIGGYWCQASVHPHRNGAYLKIYDGLTGKLLEAKKYSVICMIRGNPLWIEDLKDQIDYFDGDKFHLIRLPGQDSCWLQALR